jgi:hypothetical protein
VVEPKRGDRVSLDAKKVGQPRRSGVVRNVTKGLSGPRYEIEWTDGGRTIMAPGAGTLLIEGPERKKKAAKTKAKAKVKANDNAKAKVKDMVKAKVKAKARKR